MIPPGKAALWTTSAVLALSCVPTGSAPPYDAGVSPTATTTFKPSLNVITSVFEDNFDRPDAAEGTWPPFAASQEGGLAVAPRAEAGAAARPDDASALDAKAARDDAGEDADLLGAILRDATTSPASNLGPDWVQIRTNAWRVENGQLCVQNARNKGVWLNKTLPVNARIEFDAIAGTDDGDLKAEVWGDGQSAATGTSYTNATSYLAIFGGWKNTSHVLARKNEHGADRKEIKVDKDSDDPRQRAVVKGQVYRFKIERTDGKTVRWSIDGVDYVSWADAQPLAGQGHDHFGFNEWEAKVCFDNVKVTPL
ncbi:MAG: hypothetical protein KF819_03740 [Labilithrix sp.]|nr:hypothetical protein [Labilithrix sp.]